MTAYPELIVYYFSGTGNSENDLSAFQFDLKLLQVYSSSKKALSSY